MYLSYLDRSACSVTRQCINMIVLQDLDELVEQKKQLMKQMHDPQKEKSSAS